MNARQPHGGCWRRLAAGRLCGRYQSSTNTMDGVAGHSSGGSGRHGRSRHNLIGRVCRQLTRRLWPGSFGNRRCAFAVPFNEGLLPWFIGLPGQSERPRRSRGSLPAAWCHAQRTMGEAGSLWSIVLFVSLCFYTEASLRARNDRNVLYERIRDTLISHKRYDTYIWSAPLEALDLTSESL